MTFLLIFIGFELFEMATPSATDQNFKVPFSVTRNLDCDYISGSGSRTVTDQVQGEIVKQLDYLGSLIHCRSLLPGSATLPQNLTEIVRKIAKNAKDQTLESSFEVQVFWNQVEEGNKIATALKHALIEANLQVSEPLESIFILPAKGQACDSIKINKAGFKLVVVPGVVLKDYPVGLYCQNGSWRTLI